MNIVIVGATGMIGRAISAAILERGHDLTALVRDSSRAQSVLPAGVTRIAMPDKGDDVADGWKRAIAESDVVINLAGEPIGGARWSPEVKERLVSSRVDTTRRIVDTMLGAIRSGSKPAALINASAVGYYGDCSDDEVREDHGSGAGFLAELCQKWEDEALRARSGGVRIVIMRIGLVLAQSGVLQKMLYPLPGHVSPFKLGLGGPIGSGRQWMPWVHIDDVVGLFLLAAGNPNACGAINVTAPNPVTNAEFARTLGHLLRRPAVLPVPAIVLRAVVGEFADALLTGQRAVSAAANELGYTFRYRHLEEALKQLI
jgi:uncharacterized protein (TIGR01777 family)